MDTLLLILSLTVALIGIVVIWLGYKKDESFDPHVKAKLAKQIFVLFLVCGVINVINPLINHFKPKEKLSTMEDIQNLVRSFRDKPQNPSEKEVETDLERELKSAFIKKKKSALEEYHHGNEAYNNNQFDIAISHFQKALDIVEISSFHLALGNCSYSTSEYEIALEYYYRALRQSRSSNNKQIEAAALGNIGVIYKNKGDLDEALKYLKQALVIDKEIGYKQGEANQLGNIGLIYSYKGDLDEALKYLKDALAILDECKLVYGRDIIVNAIQSIEKQKSATNVRRDSL